MTWILLSASSWPWVGQESAWQFGYSAGHIGKMPFNTAQRCYWIWWNSQCQAITPGDMPVHRWATVLWFYCFFFLKKFQQIFQLLPCSPLTIYILAQDKRHSFISIKKQKCYLIIGLVEYQSQSFNFAVFSRYHENKFYWFTFFFNLTRFHCYWWNTDEIQIATCLSFCPICWI